MNAQNPPARAGSTTKADAKVTSRLNLADVLRPAVEAHGRMTVERVKAEHDQRSQYGPDLLADLFDQFEAAAADGRRWMADRLGCDWPPPKLAKARGEMR